MEQSVCMSLPDARPIAHLLLNSSFTARAAVVPRPSNKAPAKADVTFLRIGFVLGVGLGSFPPSFIARKAAEFGIADIPTIRFSDLPLFVKKARMEPSG